MGGDTSEVSPLCRVMVHVRIHDRNLFPIDTISQSHNLLVGADYLLILTLLISLRTKDHTDPANKQLRNSQPLKILVRSAHGSRPGNVMKSILNNYREQTDQGNIRAWTITTSAASVVMYGPPRGQLWMPSFWWSVS